MLPDERFEFEYVDNEATLSSFIADLRWAIEDKFDVEFFD